jgi:hypothetical protein
MILTSKKARRVVAVLGSAAVVAGVALPARPAAAAVTLGFGPTSLSATIVDVDPTTNPSLTYGVKVTGAPLTGDVDPLWLSVTDGPSTPGAALYSERVAGDALPAANQLGTAFSGTVGGTAGIAALTASSDPAIADNSLIEVSGNGETEFAVVTDTVIVGAGPTHTLTLDRKLADTHVAATLTDLDLATDDLSLTPDYIAAPNYTTTAVKKTAPIVNYATSGLDSIYFGAVIPGTYKFQLFRDRPVHDGLYVLGHDDATPIFTLTVKDVTGKTATTDDDLNFGLTAPSTVDLGRPVVATSVPGLTTGDVRGEVSAGIGVLGNTIAQAMTFTFTATDHLDLDGAGSPGPWSDSPTFNGTSYTLTSGVVKHGGTLTTTPELAFTGTSSPYAPAVAVAAATTVAATNLVTKLTLTSAAGQTANVKIIGTTATVRAGTTTVTYSATATGLDDVPRSGRTVWFLISAGSGIALADLTANGVVPTTGEVSAITNATGVATLVLASTKTANGNAYRLEAESNHIKSDNDADTDCDQATYVDCDKVTSTYATRTVDTATASANMLAALGSTVTITGAAKDQWGQGFKPAGGVQATLAVKQGLSGTWTDFTHIVDIAADGTFSSTYDDPTLATPRTDAYRWTISGFNLFYPNSTGYQVSWAASTTPATATLTTLEGHALPEAAGLSPEPLADHSGVPNVRALIGTLNAGSNIPLRYASFTLAGTPGVYFMDATGKLQATLTARTNSVGQIQAAADQIDDSVGVVFTKSGLATITLTAGSVTSTSGPITVRDSADPYKIVVNDVSGASGSILDVSGTVTDMFGNVVPGAAVTLSTGTSTIGVLGDSGHVDTNLAGVFSTMFTPGVNKVGTATLTGTLGDSRAEPATLASALNGVSQQPLQTANLTPDAEWVTAGLTTLPDGDYQDTGTITVAAPVGPSVTLVAPAGRVGVGTVVLRGVSSTKGMPVDIYAKAAGTNHTLMWINTVVANSTTGVWSAVERISGSTTFVARTATASSPTKTVAVISTVKWGGSRVLGHHKVMLRADGGPGGAGVLSFYNSVGTQLIRIRSIRTDGAGVRSMIWQTTPGFKRVVAIYTSPGCAPSARVSAPFRVR